MLTNEETLNLLKPIMLDGTEKVGDKVYDVKLGDGIIADTIYPDSRYTMRVKFGEINRYYTDTGYASTLEIIPSLFKVNPFEWLANQNNSQERVIEVKDSTGRWFKRVVLTIRNGIAICWDVAENIHDAKNRTTVTSWEIWRELPTKITKEEALKMLSEKGVDTTNLIIE